MRFAEAARACASGEMGFAHFAAATERRWHWWARRLARSGIPAWLDEEDIKQDLLLEAWRALTRYNEAKAKSQTVAQFVEFAAKYRAKKQVHRARGDDRHLWTWGPARYEIPFSALGKETDEDDEAIAFDVPVDADQDRAAERREAVLALAREQDNLRDFFAIEAIAAANGDIDLAAQVLYGDLDARLLLRLPCERTARTIVGRVATRIAA